MASQSFNFRANHQELSIVIDYNNDINFDGMIGDRQSFNCRGASDQSRYIAKGRLGSLICIKSLVVHCV